MAQPLTELAKKYSHPTGPKHKIIAHTGKSGMSPVYIPLAIRPGLSANQRKYIDVFEAYQRGRLHKFSAQQLVDLEAFAPFYTSPTLDGIEDIGIDFANLQSIPIHPLFSKSRWTSSPYKHIGKYPLGNGRPGYFEPDNPLVWKVLEPCLRLASGFMSCSSTLTWWDALINGSYEYIEDGIPDEWKGGKLLKFKPPSGIPSTESQLQKQLQDIANHLSFTLTSGSTDELSGLPHGEADMFHWGVTTQDMVGEVHISISFEMLEPLMRDGLNLTLAEMRLDYFRVAVTLLHETAHAIWFVICDHLGCKNMAMEPYLEGQPVPELGFSMEETIFGGKTCSITDQIMSALRMSGGVPCAATVSIPYFTRPEWQEYMSHAPLLHPLPPSWSYVETFPIPIGYFEDLFRSEFWDHVRQFGLAATRTGPRTIGKRYREKAGNKKAKLSWSPNFDTPPDTDIILDNRMTQAEEKAAKYENLRRARARRILNAIGGDQRRMVGPNLDPVDSMDVDVDPMETDEPVVEPEETDPNHYTIQGKDFDSVSTMLTEKSQGALPDCPRYEEIRKYIMANRARGSLCLDTMNFEIPAYNLLQYIYDFGGINITSDEWIAFLKTCDDTGECFIFWDKGQGLVKWLESAPPSPALSASSQRLPTPATAALFYEACMSYDWFYESYPDFDFWFLLKLLKHVDPRGGIWLNAQVLRELVDWHDEQGDLWRWGPIGIVRRRTDTWPEPIDDSDTSWSLNSSDAS